MFSYRMTGGDLGTRKMKMSIECCIDKHGIKDFAEYTKSKIHLQYIC